MWGGSGGSGSSGGGGGGDVMGGVTKAWVSQNFVSIEFFGRLFETYDSATPTPTQVLPNDLESTITNIKAKFGLWTEQYLSALGQGTGGGGGGASALTDLVDVTITNPTQGQVLTYDGNGHWINGAAASGGISLADMWYALGTPDSSKQIDASHLSTALNDMATQTWVSQNYLGANATAAAATKLATARSLWGQSFDGTANVSGSMTGVGDIQCASGSRIYGNGGTLYIGNANDADWVKMSDMCSRQGDSYWKIYSTGSATFANVLSNGYVTALSDIRRKHVVSRFHLKPEAIAMASIIRFRLKESKDQTIHVGGIAQEWQEIMPDAVVKTDDGFLSMDYSVIAYASAVSLARIVVNQQQKIDKLEKRLARLEAMFALTEDEED
jgi:hypothetical protein